MKSYLIAWYHLVMVQFWWLQLRFRSDTHPNLGGRLAAWSHHRYQLSRYLKNGSYL